MAAAPVKHQLGFGNGKILEYPDGTAAYVKSMEVTQAFRVHISDFTGFYVPSTANCSNADFTFWATGRPWRPWTYPWHAPGNTLV